MKLMMFSTLALASSLLAGCEADGGSSVAAEHAATAEGGTDADLVPEVDPKLAKYNVNLPKKGEMLPDIAGMTLAGKSVDNEWLKGKTVLINLWFYG